MADLKAIVEREIGRRVVDQRPAAGGCINDARLLTLDDGQRVFAKTNSAAATLPDMFESEAAGLRALADAASSLHVPRPIAAGADFIIIEAVDVDPSGAGLDEALGEGLAQLHRNGSAARFGFDVDNYLGTTPQANGWHDEWIRFWADRRLKPMLDALGDDGEVNQLGVAVLDKLDRILASSEQPPALLHGDLWSGNAMLDTAGRAVVIDPAAYYGHREAEFGMTRLFGFGARFEAAYNQAYPLADGADRRIAVYTLHHLLNHLLIFGSGYRGQCVSLMRAIV